MPKAPKKPTAPATTKPRLLLVPDQLEWTLDRIAQQLQRWLGGAYNITRQEFTDIRKASTDVLLTLWWGHHALLQDNVEAQWRIVLVCDHYSWRSPDQQDLLRGTLKQADALFTISPRLMLDLKEHGLYLPDRTFFVPDGVDTQMFSPCPLPENFTAGWLGRTVNPKLREQRGIDLLSEACECIGVPFRILDATDKKVPHTDVPNWMKGCSVILTADRAAGTPCPLLECAAMGRVPITTLVGIADDLITHGDNGLIVERKPAAFAQALNYLRNRPREELTAMGQRARDRAETWSWQRSAQLWKDAIGQVLQLDPSTRKALPVPAPVLKRAPISKKKGQPHKKGKGDDRPLIYIGVDRLGWAFHNIANQVIKTYGHLRNFRVYPIGELISKGPRLAPAHTLISFWWRSMPRLRTTIRATRYVTCLYDFYSWHEHKKELQEVLDSSDMLLLANELLHRTLLDHGFRLPEKTILVPDGVDLSLFPLQPFPDEFAVGWTGNSYASKLAGSKDDIKGFAVIERACEQAGAKLVSLDAASGQILPHTQMATGFYRKICMYVCFSLAEGGPNTAKEAAACGRSCITTRVGDMLDFIVHGESGVFVERDEKALVEMLHWAKTCDYRTMGLNARAQAEQWSWRRLVQNWGYALGLEMGIVTPGMDSPEASEAVVTERAQRAHQVQQGDRGTEGEVTLQGDVQAEVTAFLITSGEPSTAEALKHLERQTLLPRIEVIEGFSPMWRAFQEMISRCQTRWYIQVDADMLLRPNAIATMLAAIRKEDTKTAMHVEWLWGDAEERPIQGCKIYDHLITRKYPYQDSLSCEMPQIYAMQKDGYKVHVAPEPEQQEECIGLHYSLQTPELAFLRWQRLMRKFRTRDYMEWLTPYPRKLLAKFMEEPTSIRFAAMAGAILALGEPPPNETEYDASSVPTDAKRIIALMDPEMIQGPKELTLYLTSRCNHHCRFCRRQLDAPRDQPDMGLATIAQTLESFPSIQSVCVAGFGEPLLHPKLAEILRMLRSRNLFIGLITNGASLSAQLQVLQLNRPNYISVSLNAADRESHMEIVKADTWQAVLQGIRLGLQAGLNIGASSVVTKSTLDAVPKIIELAHDLGLQFLDLHNLLPHGDPFADYFTQEVLRIEDAEVQGKLRSLKQHQHASVVRSWPTCISLDPDKCPRRCQSPFMSMGVSAFGWITGCRRVLPPDSNYGGIGWEPLWSSSSHLMQLRKALVGDTSLPPFCARCFGNWSG